jgi:hypothetical protein
MKESKKIQVHGAFRILSINLIDFQCRKTLPKSFKKESIKFDFVLGGNGNNLKRIFSIDLTLNLYSSGSKELKLGSIKTTGDFEIPDFDNIVVNDSVQIPENLLAAMIGAVVSTTRGFLILKSEGTILQGVVIPFINSRQLLPPTKSKR